MRSEVGKTAFDREVFALYVTRFGQTAPEYGTPLNVAKVLHDPEIKRRIDEQAIRDLREDEAETEDE